MDLPTSVFVLPIAGSILALTTLLPAQAATGTFPPGYLTKESSSGACIYDSPWTLTLGVYPASRHQFAYGDLKGKGAITMKEISFRQDGSRLHSRSVARTWANLKVQVADTNLATLSGTWTRNHLNPPTQVYNQKHSWPKMTTNPPGAPEPWDNGGLKIVFKGPYVYTAKSDMLFDLEFAGGTLANAATWGTSTRKTIYLDGRSVFTSCQGRISIYGLRSPCTYDSDYTGTSTLGGGYGFWVAITYNSPSNRFGFRTYRTNMPKSHPFIHFYSLGGTTSTKVPGPIPGLGCQALQLDLGKMFFAETLITDSTGTFRQANQYVPYISGLVGVQIWAQGVWSDTKTKATHLTMTSRLTIAALLGKADFSGKRVYRYASGTPPKIPVTGFAPSTRYIPIIRYK